MKITSADRRKLRTRRKIVKSQGNRLRLSVFRSSKYIYAQIIDDKNGHTLASVSSNAMKSSISGDKLTQAKLVGKALAEIASEKGIKNVIFDRGEYRYHGRVKALADAAREGGLDF